MAFSDVWTYDTAASLSFDATKVMVTGGHLQFLTPSPYTLTPQVITTQHQNSISALASFVESSSLPANTAITYQVVLNGLVYWWSATLAKWTLSDSTVAQSNTAAVINSHASALISDLSLLTNQFFTLRIWLSTTNTSNTPQLTSNTIGYSWANSNPATINQCIISANLKDLAGLVPLPTSTTTAALVIGSPVGFFHSGNFVEPFSKSFAFSTVDGSLSASVIETATPGQKLNLSVTFWDGQSIKSVKLNNAIIPNQPSILLSNLTSPVLYDFG